VLHDGSWEERYLCFSPQERVFSHGEWHDGIEPEFALDAAGRAAFKQFDEEIARHRASGEFTIPMATGVRRESPLDRLSMADWLKQHRLDAPALGWYVDYACRDDYGALAAHTSAWAGIHYFASRAHDEQGPLTWPEGNGWIVKRLAAQLAPHIHTGEPAVRVERAGNRWRVRTAIATYLTDSVIFAAPTFLLPYIVPELASHRSSLIYSPWLTANITLDRPPRERGRGAPLSWDNVIYESPALGYVDATHQSLRTRADRSVWTYYWSLADISPADGRKKLASVAWHDCIDAILRDLEQPHPDIRDCVSRIDVMRMGHAMVRPSVGFLADTTAAENIGIAAKALLPGRVTNHEHVLRARPIFFLAKGPAQHRRDPEHVKVAGGDPAALQPHRLAADLRGGVDIDFGREHVERSQPALQLGEIQGGGRIDPGGAGDAHAWRRTGMPPTLRRAGRYIR